MTMNIKFLLATVFVATSCMGMETGQKRTREDDVRATDAFDGLSALGSAALVPAPVFSAIATPIALYPAYVIPSIPMNVVAPMAVPAGVFGSQVGNAPWFLGFGAAVAVQESLNSINPASERAVAPRIADTTAGAQARLAAVARAAEGVNVVPQQVGGDAAGDDAVVGDNGLTVYQRKKKRQQEKIKEIAGICERGDLLALEEKIRQKQAHASYALLGNALSGFTRAYPVHAVARHNQPALLLRLVENGADINTIAKNNSKQLLTALDVAQRAGNEEMVALIRSLGGKSYAEKEKEQASAGGGVSGSGVLESAQGEGLTAQQRAKRKQCEKIKNIAALCKNGNIQGFKILLKENAQNVNYVFNALGLQNSRPIHGAALRGHLDLVRYLIDNGADINALAKKRSNRDQKLTPYDVAPEGPIKELLRKHGGRSYAELQAEKAAGGGAGGGY